MEESWRSLTNSYMITKGRTRGSKIKKGERDTSHTHEIIECE